MKYQLILIYFTFLNCNRIHVCAFNVETNHYAIYKGDIHSMFGFSVAQYRDQNHRGWVIVGAPLNQTKQIGVNKGGTVFRCDIAEDSRCFPVEFDKKGVDYVKSTKKSKGIEPIDDKSYQWFGATISTSMIDGGPLLACAPKYHWFGYIKANWSVAGFKDVVGSCWLTTLNNGSSIEYSPCRNNDTAGHHRQGMCQAGVGAAITKDGKRLFIGAPGSWYWQGQLFSVESNVVLPFVPIKDVHSAASKIGDAIQNEQLSLLSTKEGPAYEDNSYLGYSVTVGDFMGNGDSGVAVGVPRGSELHGKVLLFTSQLFNHQNITGEQMGAYFGYALAVNDIDGDGLDDLIITAPFFTRPEFASIKIETGRIYVFYQKGGLTEYQKFDTRDGVCNRGQFGLSVASLGDIDLDGYGDVVIGEPYGGPENRGAIYIYHGRKEGIKENYSQVIYSENLEQPVRTFGWAVSGGLDLDGNHYPDIVVGAYESETVLHFRSRPIVNMFAELSFITNSINLKKKVCVLSDGSAVACSKMKICCMYTGLGSWPLHDFTINISLDDKKRNNPRLFFLDFENKNNLNWTVTITKDQLYCRERKVYVAEHVRDKLTPLDAEMQIQLSKDISQSAYASRKRDPRRKLMAILGPTNTIKRNSLTIQKNCGSDNVCIPDLTVNVVKNIEKYLLGSGKILELEVNIANNGEDAYEAVFYLLLPVGIDYINVESESASTEIIIQCSAPKVSNNNTLRCDIGNPLPEGKVIKFKVFLQPMTLYGMKPTYELNLKVNSTNPERFGTFTDNILNVYLPIWVETDILIEGESKPQEIDFNSVDYINTESDIFTSTLKSGPIILHNYTIRNNGPSIVMNITTSLIWTAETLSGDVLLYLIDQPEISSNKIRCESANANYLSLSEKRKTRDTNEELIQPNRLDNFDSFKTKYSQKKFNPTLGNQNFMQDFEELQLKVIKKQDQLIMRKILKANNHITLQENKIPAKQSQQKRFIKTFDDEIIRKDNSQRNLDICGDIMYKDFHVSRNNSPSQVYNLKFIETLKKQLKSVFNDTGVYELCLMNDQLYVQFLAKYLTSKNTVYNYIELFGGATFPLYNKDTVNEAMKNDEIFTKHSAQIIVTDTKCIYFLLRNGEKFSMEKLNNNFNFCRFESNDIIEKTKEKRLVERTNRYARETNNHLILNEKIKNEKQSLFDPQFLCKSAQCVHLKCYVGPLNKDEEVSIAARYRIDMKSLNKISHSEKFKVSTKLFALITSQPFIGEPSERVIRSCEIATHILPTKNLHKSDIIPLWIVVLSACAGTAILLLLVYLLNKCGFFNRNRPSSAPERQPLNRSKQFLDGDN